MSTENPPPGAVVRAAMQRSHTTGVDLAALSGYTQHHISEILCNKAAITPRFAQALADAGVVPTAWEMRELGPRNAAEFWACLSPLDRVRRAAKEEQA